MPTLAEDARRKPHKQTLYSVLRIRQIELSHLHEKSASAISIVYSDRITTSSSLRGCIANAGELPSIGLHIQNTERIPLSPSQTPDFRNYLSVFNLR